MTPGSSCNDLLADLCGEHCEFDGNMIVFPSEIVEIIRDLACKNTPGLDGLTGEHMQLSSVQLPVLISILISAMLIHSCIPKHILTSVMVPIIKNKNKSSTDKNNYRPICISNVFTKIVKKVLYRRMEKYINYIQSIWLQAHAQYKHVRFDDHHLSSVDRSLSNCDAGGFSK